MQPDLQFNLIRSLITIRRVKKHVLNGVNFCSFAFLHHYPFDAFLREHAIVGRGCEADNQAGEGLVHIAWERVYFLNKLVNPTNINTVQFNTYFNVWLLSLKEFNINTD